MLAVHKTGIINKNLDSSATWKFWILPSFSLPPTPFCLSLSSCVNFAIWILPLPFLSFTSLVLFFIFFFFLFFSFPLTRPHSMDSQAVIGKTATYFRTHRTGSFSQPHHQHPFTWLPGSHIFCISSSASLRSPSSALFLCTPTLPQPGLQADFASQPLHNTRCKVLD